MSITYDPEKWTNPLRANEIEDPPRKSTAPVLVSIHETRFFKPGPKLDSDTDFNRILVTGNLVEQPRTPADAEKPLKK